MWNENEAWSIGRNEEIIIVVMKKTVMEKNGCDVKYHNK